MSFRMVAARFAVFCSAGLCSPEFCSGLLHAEDALRKYDFQQREMGTAFRISVYAPEESAANAAAKAAFARIRQLNGVFSDYDENSELMRLCRKSGPGKPVDVSPELFRVLHASVQLARETDGAFDVSVGHLTRLWRRARRRKEMPDADELKQALAKTGHRHIRLKQSTGPKGRKRFTVELAKSGMQLDLGGVAKGYAGDEALKTLKKHGLSRAMVDAGGDVVLGDPPPGRPGWTIGVAPLNEPDRNERERNDARLLTLSNAAVATSGDAYQSVTIDGKRYSHILDPETGLGLTQRRSVTVIAPDGMQADSLASAVSVLGAEKGLKLAAKKPDVEAAVTVLGDGKAATKQTRGFANRLRKP